MPIKFLIPAILLLALNIFSLFVMLADKKRAEQQKRRVSEKTLFLLTLFFGGVGIFLGMIWWRHKTQKWYFVIGVPLLIMGDIYLLIRLNNLLNIF